METETNKKAVQSTSKDALKQKVNAIEKNYYADPFQLEFIKPENKQNFLPLINKGTWSRVFGIRNQLNHILSNHHNKSIQIINLGCGMDSTHFYLCNIFPELKDKITTIEVDYPEIIKEKIKFIKSSKLLQSKISELIDQDFNNLLSEDNKCFLSKNYKLISCELSDHVKLLKIIESSNFNNKDSLSIILAECLFCYLRYDDVVNLLKSLNKIFEESICIFYDLVNPNDDFGKMMIKNLKTYREISLPSYLDCPDEKSHIDRMLKSDFHHCECVNMLEYYESIDREFKKTVDNLELIDELEEFNLLQKHTCIGIAIKSDSKLKFLENYGKLK